MVRTQRHASRLSRTALRVLHIAARLVRRKIVSGVPGRTPVRAGQRSCDSRSCRRSGAGNRARPARVSM